MLKLSICMPTYNRAEKFKRLLDFLYREVSEMPYRKDIEFVVCNNCSTDNTKDVVKSSKLFNSDCNTRYICNSKNIGLLGNIGVSYQKAPIGEYVWIMGDDDDYVPGIVDKVFEQVNKNEYSYIFINHDGISKGKAVMPSAIEGVDADKTNCSVVLDLFNAHGTTMMFMSACIFRTDLVKDAFKHRKLDLVTPCYLSFYCASQGKTKIIKDILIHDSFDGISWRKDSYKVFDFQIPQVLHRLYKLSYDKRYISETFSRYIKTRGGYYNILKRTVKHHIQMFVHWK